MTVLGSFSPKLRTLLLLGVVLAGMTGLVVGAVPLYRLFCQVTGYDGTTRVADAAPGAVAGARIMTIQFNADVGKGMAWRFKPEAHKMDVRIGEQTLAFYTASNPTGRTITGTATYNVTPDKAGIYFNKIECFCFTEQTLGPGESAEFPVSFFVDPALLDDPALDNVKTITLSYTFFEQEGGTAADEKPARTAQQAANAAATRVN
ncbi:MAG: cytochrome c oxidase assembly protein [Alphaproteobacteria bacterium]